MLRRFGYHIRRSLGTHGLLRSLAIAGFRCDEWFGDWHNGIETRRACAMRQGPFYYDYEATDYRVINRALRLVERSHSEVVFLDFGCGKGRVVALAATRSFRRVVGVDLNEEMIALARANLAGLRKPQHCHDVTLLCHDAMWFDVPDDVNAVFFFNPFSLEVLDVVVLRLAASLRRVPRRMTILYLHPNEPESDPFAQLDWCQHLTNIPVARHRGLRFPVYETCGEAP